MNHLRTVWLAGWSVSPRHKDTQPSHPTPLLPRPLSFPPCLAPPYSWPACPDWCPQPPSASSRPKRPMSFFASGSRSTSPISFLNTHYQVTPIPSSLYHSNPHNTTQSLHTTHAPSHSTLLSAYCSFSIQLITCHLPTIPLFISLLHAHSTDTSNQTCYAHRL
ncbi:hypothetical protein Pcinc_005244 [Petrolisthes cinctipes]|uniref:Uncharacterized protein n=1 Tax=Petrolisthes cinctipes TaxID=88211 RepID=A0AAE1GFM2_PETCI|nr:hypothetical protein Pcinc_005244 [Petrolisthes cinctipes]